MAASAFGLSEKVDISLTENDITGASLHPPFDKHNVAKLRW